MAVVGVVAVAFLGFWGGRTWMMRRKDARRVARITSGAAELEIAVSKYRPGWARLKETVKPSPHFRASPVAVA